MKRIYIGLLAVAAFLPAGIPGMTGAAGLAWADDTAGGSQAAPWGLSSVERQDRGRAASPPPRPNPTNTCTCGSIFVFRRRIASCTHSASPMPRGTRSASCGAQ